MEYLAFEMFSNGFIARKAVKKAAINKFNLSKKVA
jgi:hypothetical protein